MPGAPLIQGATYAKSNSFADSLDTYIPAFAGSTCVRPTHPSVILSTRTSQGFFTTAALSHTACVRVDGWVGVVAGGFTPLHNHVGRQG